MKRKTKRFNGEYGSDVEDIRAESDSADEDSALAEARADYERRKAARKSGGDRSEVVGTTEEFRRPIKSTQDAVHETAETAETAEAPKNVSFGAAFAAAREKALKGGPKTFEWRGKTYGTALAGEGKTAKKAEVKKAEPKAEVSSKSAASQAAAPAQYKPTPAKTSRQEIEEIIERTPLSNPSGGLDVLNVLKRSKEVGGAAMKESGRQARVDRIRRNVGSNLETYGMKKGGKVSSASSRADGIAQRGKTRGKLY